MQLSEALQVKKTVVLNYIASSARETCNHNQSVGEPGV